VIEKKTNKQKKNAIESNKLKL